MSEIRTRSDFGIPLYKQTFGKLKKIYLATFFSSHLGLHFRTFTVIPCHLMNFSLVFYSLQDTFARTSVTPVITAKQCSGNNSPSYLTLWGSRALKVFWGQFYYKYSKCPKSKGSDFGAFQNRLVVQSFGFRTFGL